MMAVSGLEHDNRIENRGENRYDQTKVGQWIFRSRTQADLRWPSRAIQNCHRGTIGRRLQKMNERVEQAAAVKRLYQYEQTGHQRQDFPGTSFMTVHGDSRF
jgi:hypothetical protein